jgi:hypothetical protein
VRPASVSILQHLLRHIHEVTATVDIMSAAAICIQQANIRLFDASLRPVREEASFYLVIFPSGKGPAAQSRERRLPCNATTSGELQLSAIRQHAVGSQDVVMQQRRNRRAFPIVQRSSQLLTSVQVCSRNRPDRCCARACR